MSLDNLSAVLYGKGDLRLEQTPIPDPPQKNEVIIATQSVGVCRSDVQYWEKGSIGRFVLTSPIILGHETSGIVVDIGDGVTHLNRGDAVAVEPGVPCRYCFHCREGSYNLCKDIHFCATPPFNGTLTRLFKHEADFCYKLPSNVSYEEAAMMEPMSVGIHACTRAGVSLGDNLLICGAGPIGLMCLLVAKSVGSGHICVTDINPERLELAKKLGANSVYRVVPGVNEDNLVEEIEKIFDALPDAVIECTGAESSVRLALLSAKSGGTVLIVGHGPSEIQVPLTYAAIREVDIKGVFRYRHCYPKALKLLENGRIDVKPMITHRFKLDDTLAAFEMAKSGKGIKVMIDCSE